MSLTELQGLLGEQGEPSYRAKQLFSWMHQRLAASYEEMTNLPRSLREKLESYPLTVLQAETVQTSMKDGTKKYLFRLGDGCYVESVLMPYSYGNSVCISSQVGCAMGCRFCASTIGGKERDLLPSEMLDQIYRIQAETKERVSHVVVMGSGEPLDNLENLIRFLDLLGSEEGLHLGMRNVTVSTCGLVPGIRLLAEKKYAITLALSLHAPDDEIRKTIMPVAKRYPLDEVLSACAYYFSQTGRRVTFEYSLIAGVNDAPWMAKKLAGRLKPLQGHVNLIPVNPVAERGYHRTQKPNIELFKKELEKNGINVTIRREMGSDIDGACGQLRARYREKQP
ncbi:MAG: 23S rRNA (adenine(2503)-C(2))-methyltransferase RlmN [Blautia sp.]|nr:23S rRNA (adenine(2503)-C(2))-methyltransferase RlmN [Blautia sp.]